MGSYSGAVRGANRADVVVAACFAVAAVGESVVRHHAHPAMLGFHLAGDVGLLVLALRRRRPLLVLGVLAALAVLGTAVGSVLWPGVEDSAGVWILALLLAAYSCGAHASGPGVALGIVLPMVVVVTADASTRTGWAQVSGIVFVTVFVGLFPTAIGRLVRIRGEGLATLRRQRGELEAAQRRRQESAVLAERLRMADRLQPTLAEGLRRLAAEAESGADPERIETAARALLTRTREEVVELTAPVTTTPEQAPPRDLLPALRSTAQRWVVLSAAGIATGLVLESAHALPVSGPRWAVPAAALALGLPLAFVWWRPVPAVTLAFAATALFARVVAPIDGTLSETALAMGATFAVAALSRTPGALLGLGVCLLGQLVGVGTDDPLGEALVLLTCWAGGRAVNRVSLLVEQTRANNEALRSEEPAAAERALVAERLRLARDLHDAVGHSLTVITLQAGAARRLATTDPQRSREAVGTVAAVARDGLASLSLGSQPGGLRTLLDGVRAAGLVVDAQVDGVDQLGEATRTTVLRVVQECLTNVIRHSPGARATVVVRLDADRVAVTVSNTPAASRPAGSGPAGSGTAGSGAAGGHPVASVPPGSGAAGGHPVASVPPGSGRGLSGIRERVTAGSGSVAWGRLPGGGFEVNAVLPVPSLIGTPS